jgi:hypothetical protein
LLGLLPDFLLLLVVQGFVAHWPVLVEYHFARHVRLHS